MFLSKKCTYGIRALIYLLSVYPNGQLTIPAIAANTKIPKKFLDQVLLQLNKAGILKSKKGSRGGYSLHKSPREITIYEIIEALSGPILVAECAENNFYCNKKEKCKVNDYIMETSEKIKAIFKETSLQQIYDRPLKNPAIYFTI
jgi:Rrf2 family protein